jgi:hypothetical protein
MRWLLLVLIIAQFKNPTPAITGREALRWISLLGGIFNHLPPRIRGLYASRFSKYRLH